MKILWLYIAIQSLEAQQVSFEGFHGPYGMIIYHFQDYFQDYIPDFGVFGDYVCDFGSYADLGEAKSVCKDGLNFLECDIILELRERSKFKNSFFTSLKKLSSSAKFTKN